MEERLCITQEAASMQNAAQLTKLYIEATNNGTLLDVDIFIAFQCHTVEGDRQPI
jgi:hypothetical protein